MATSSKPDFSGNSRWTGANGDEWVKEAADFILNSKLGEPDPSGAWIDLSAIPAPARPLLAEALQAAVARLAEGGAGLDPTGGGDLLMRELLRRHMGGLLGDAARAEKAEEDER